MSRRGRARRRAPAPAGRDALSPREAALLALAFLVPSLVLALGLVLALRGPAWWAWARSSDAPWSGPPRALLYDQIALDDPRRDFRDAIEGSLAAAGYELRVVPPEEATVRRFQALPEERPDLLILRAHSALLLDEGRWTDEVALFTSEPVDLERFAVTGLEAAAGGAGAAPGEAAGLAIEGGAGPGDDGAEGSEGARAREVSAPGFDAAELAALVPVRRRVGEDRRPFYGLGAAFVRDHLRGRFDPGTTVLLMGCDGMRGRGVSEAFLARGAGAVIGWSDVVSAAHTDRAGAVLVDALARGQDAAEAVGAAMREVGPDPVSGAYLIAAVR